MKRNVYISVMGTMGSGKTTAAKLLASTLGYTLLEENFGENAFLSRFYMDMKRWAFHSQTFFLMEKIAQLLASSSFLAQDCVVQDTPIEQDVFSYAKAQHVLGNMDDAEWRLYLKIYREFAPQFPKPDVIIQLKADLPVLVGRIQSRGRGYEQNIPEGYIELLDLLNTKWLADAGTKVLPIRTDAMNIAKSPHAKTEFVNMIRSELEKL